MRAVRMAEPRSTGLDLPVSVGRHFFDAEGNDAVAVALPEILAQAEKSLGPAEDRSRHAPAADRCPDRARRVLGEAAEQVLC